MQAMFCVILTLFFTRVLYRQTNLNEWLGSSTKRPERPADNSVGLLRKGEKHGIPEGFYGALLNS